MKKERVLIVHNYYQIPGGEDTVVSNEKRLLENHGHEVFLYSRNNSEIKDMSKIQKIGLAFTTVFNWRTYREVKRIIKNERIDIVHVHNTLSLISPSVYYAAVQCKIPVIQTIHNFRMLCPGATFYRDGHICEDCVEHGLMCAIKHSCYRGSKLQTLVCVISTSFHRMAGIYKKVNFICLTEFNKRKLLELNLKKQLINPRKVFVKPNFTFDTNTENRGSIGRYYLFVGRLEEIKGIKLVLDAFALLPNQQLFIAGAGQENYETFVQKKKLNNIRFLGFLNRENLQKIFRGAKAMICASQTYEGFPMTIVEAYANRVPVITVNMGNSGDLVKEGVHGIHFQHDSAKALAEAVLRFEKLNQGMLRDNAFDCYEREYTADVNYVKLIEIYRLSD